MIWLLGLLLAVAMFLGTVLYFAEVEKILKKKLKGLLKDD